jgi:hypothetical protein
MSALSILVCSHASIMASDKKSPKVDEGKKKLFRPYGRTPKEETKGGLPMLRFGKGNNFYKFKAQLSNVAIEKYGNLGKLIELEKYYTPALVIPDFRAKGVSAANIGAMELEAVKAHTKRLEKMVEDRPKLYGLIMQHMSVESRDEVAQDPDYATWHAENDPEKLWQAIVKMHKVDCVSNVTAVQELTARKAYQNIKQGAYETLAQYSERFREVYKGYKETGTTENPVNTSESEQAMDFFHGLDPGRYGAFKTSMINGLSTTAFDPPTTVNDIYRVAATWVKPTSRIEGGTAVSFVTIEEVAKQQAKKNNKEKAKQEAKKAAAAAAEQGTSQQKQTKDLSHIQCFRCKEFGHYSTSPDCPKKQKQEQATAMVTMEHTFCHSTWEEYEASIFATRTEQEPDIEEYTVEKAVHVTRELRTTDVLLDNQADISIIHPSLLTGVKPSEKKIKISGVGGVQLIVDQVGFLKGFFKVYASADTKANVLSMAAVEEVYPITYKQGHLRCTLRRETSYFSRERVCT